MVGGRRLTLPAFVATLVTTWYGGILGVGEFTYLYGLSNWFVFGLPYYLFAILYAFILGPKIRSKPGLTIPDQIGSQFGSLAGGISAVWTFFMTLPAPYMVMVGLLLSWGTGWPLTLCIVIGTLFSMLYVISGGFNAVVRTDKLQFLLMFGGFLVLLVILIANYGGIAFLRNNLPPAHLTPSGGNNPTFILVWYLIAIWTFVDPGFHQRCSAASSPEVAKKGILLSVFFWLIFDLMTTAAGLYARALLPGMANPALSFPVMAHQVLPPLASGLFLTGLLATIMSTIDSFSLLSAISIGHDLLARFRPGKIASVTGIRIGLGITTVAALVMAILLPSVVQLWYVIGTLFVPPMLLPMMSSYFQAFRIPKPWILANLLLGFMVPLAWLLTGLINSGDPLNPMYPFEIQPMFPGLAVSFLLFVSGRIHLFTRKNIPIH